METLVIIFVLWSIFKALSERAKDRRPVPQQRPEQEAPAYRLPPELRDKWGPKTERPKEKKQPAELILSEPPEQPHKYKITQAKDKAATVLVEKVPAGKLNKQEPPITTAACRPESPAIGPLTPAMLREGIILSEILGPPVARRRKNRPYH